MSYRPAVFIILFLTFCTFSFCFTKTTGDTVRGTKWVGTWSTAPQLVEPGNNPQP